jgi:hypothetical protein
VKKNKDYETKEEEEEQDYSGVGELWSYKELPNK